MVSDIPTGDWKIANLFYSVQTYVLVIVPPLYCTLASKQQKFVLACVSIYLNLPPVAPSTNIVLQLSHTFVYILYNRLFIFSYIFLYANFFSLGVS
jgi:hypothetical protein